MSKPQVIPHLYFIALFELFQEYPAKRIDKKIGFKTHWFNQLLQIIQTNCQLIIITKTKLAGLLCHAISRVNQVIDTVAHKTGRSDTNHKGYYWAAWKLLNVPRMKSAENRQRQQF